MNTDKNRKIYHNHGRLIYSQLLLPLEANKQTKKPTTDIEDLSKTLSTGLI